MSNGTMTEDEWLTCTGTPGRMMRFLRQHYPIKEHPAYRRKLHLLACAGSHRLRGLLAEQGLSRSLTNWWGKILEVSERACDGRATPQEKKQARERVAREHRTAFRRPRMGGTIYLSVRSVVQPSAWDAALGVLDAGYHAALLGTEPVEEYLAAMCVLAREVFDNPFHPRTADPIWLAWNEGTLPRLARALYEERRFHELPILADGLEEAGCCDEHFLGHCRAKAEHVRGCWLVDVFRGANSDT
jgi:hypothetical protein